MGEKAEQKKDYILEQAKKVFAEKGFRKVTMKDIVSACKISRGGVYLYFSSTDKIFEEVLRMNAEADQNQLTFPAPDTISAKELMKQFLNAQKNELLHPKDSLMIATYEFYFSRNNPLDKKEFERKYQQSLRQLSNLIQYGVEQGEFSVEPCAAAQNIIFLLEGLRISSTVLAFEEAFLDAQMDRILVQLQGGPPHETK